MTKYSIPFLFLIHHISANAGTGGAIPEPGALSLLGIGAVAGLAIWAKNRGNKKK